MCSCLILISFFSSRSCLAFVVGFWDLIYVFGCGMCGSALEWDAAWLLQGRQRGQVAGIQKYGLELHVAGDSSFCKLEIALDVFGVMILLSALLGN